MNKVTILIGNIGSGKSTWIEKNYKNAVVISKDITRKSFAKCIGKDYLFDDALELYVHDITTNLFKGVLYLKKEHIIYDETNMTAATRAPFIIIAKEFNYLVNAIIFSDIGEDEHMKKCNSSKDITKEKLIEIYRWKKSRFESPTKEEGFDSIIYL